MSTAKIVINKQDTKSRIIGDVITVRIDSSQVSNYVALIKATFPTTEVEVKGIDGR